MMPTDPAYRAADPDDFPAMIEPGRYARRSSDFEEIIARTEEHFWNPEDPDYVDFSAPFPTDQDTIVPTWFVLESNTAVWDRLDEGQRIKSEEHTSELQSLTKLVCRLLLEKKKTFPQG